MKHIKKFNENTSNSKDKFISKDVTNVTVALSFNFHFWCKNTGKH